MSEVPVVLFAYRRAEVLKDTLAGLRVNEIPRLVVYCDGPKDEFERDDVEKVRGILRRVDWTKVHLVERQTNLGVGRSVMAGVTEALAEFESVIVFEDDIVANPGTYSFMRSALERYKDDPKVMSVTGWTHPRAVPADVGDKPYFDGRAECWSWGTWRRAWIGMKRPTLELVRECVLRGIDPYRYGADLVEMAIREEGANYWDVRWSYHHLVNGGLCLRPPWSLVENIGWGEHATNTKSDTGWRQELVKPGPAVPDRWPEPVENAACATNWQREMGRGPTGFRRKVELVRLVLAGRGLGGRAASERSSGIAEKPGPSALDSERAISFGGGATVTRISSATMAKGPPETQLRGVVPVVLFTYRRPGLLERTLEGLRQNSVPLLLAYSDGPKDESIRENVEEVRRILRKVDWTEVRLIERQTNLGLGRSVMAGVAEVLAEFETVIVFEDDIVATPGTYSFMRTALERYRDDSRVMSVTAWTHPRILPADVGGRSYFDGRAESWSWGTWRRAWIGMDRPALALVRECILRGIDPYRYGADLVEMAIREERENLWAVRWSYNHLVKGGLCLRPPWSLVENIGWGDDATNTKSDAGWQLEISPSAGIPESWPEPVENPACPGIWQRAVGGRPTGFRKYVELVRLVLAGRRPGRRSAAEASRGTS